MKLSALFGIDRYVRRARIVVGEGALAAEDRAQLLGLALAEERQRLRTIATLLVLVMGLTIVAASVASAAIVVHFWDGPYRTTAAWLVALFWFVVWLVSVLTLLSRVQSSSPALDAARRELAQDWDWMRAQIGGEKPLAAGVDRRPRTREELLRRIERQRERVAQLRTPPPESKGAAGDATLSETATRLVREHPVATAAVAAGVVAVVGPRRLMRLAGWLAPTLWRMRQ